MNKQFTNTKYFAVYQLVLHLQSSLTLMQTLRNALKLFIASHSWQIKVILHQNHECSSVKPNLCLCQDLIKHFSMNAFG